MTPPDIFREVETFSVANGHPLTTLCDLHSACRPQKGRAYMCGMRGLSTPVIDFDEVKTAADRQAMLPARKSVDALALPPSHTSLCFVELKSWELHLQHHGTPEEITGQARKYESALPLKLTDSLAICRQITGDPATFDGCRVIFALVTEINVHTDGLMAFKTNMDALAGASSNLHKLCNKLSQGALSRISGIETRYWECRDFDRKIATL